MNTFGFVHCFKLEFQVCSKNSPKKFKCHFKAILRHFFHLKFKSYLFLIFDLKSDKIQLPWTAGCFQYFAAWCTWKRNYKKISENGIKMHPKFNQDETKMFMYLESDFSSLCWFLLETWRSRDRVDSSCLESIVSWLDSFTSSIELKAEGGRIVTSSQLNSRSNCSKGSRSLAKKETK